MHITQLVFVALIVGLLCTIFLGAHYVIDATAFGTSPIFSIKWWTPLTYVWFTIPGFWSIVGLIFFVIYGSRIEADLDRRWYAVLMIYLWLAPPLLLFAASALGSSLLTGPYLLGTSVFLAFCFMHPHQLLWGIVPMKWIGLIVIVAGIGENIAFRQWPLAVAGRWGYDATAACGDLGAGLVGAAGNDTLDGGVGADTLSGAAGDDVTDNMSGNVAERAMARLGARFATLSVTDAVREGRVLIRAFSAGGSMAGACTPEQAHAARGVLTAIVAPLNGGHDINVLGSSFSATAASRSNAAPASWSARTWSAPRFARLRHPANEWCLSLSSVPGSIRTIGRAARGRSSSSLNCSHHSNGSEGTERSIMANSTNIT